MASVLSITVRDNIRFRWSSLLRIRRKRYPSALTVSLLAHNITPDQPRKPIFMVPFDRDETFVGRQDILSYISQRLDSLRRRAVLSGIGGVG